MSIKPTNKIELRDQLEKYTINWKWFLISFLFMFLLALFYLRYAPDQYLITATIKIADSNNDSNVLSEVNQVNEYGLFSRQSNSVNDEISVLKSKSLIEHVVEDLNLNIQYYLQGKIVSSEIFKKPPLTVTFFTNDSIIKKIDTVFTVHVDSKTKYTFKGSTKKLNFGEKASTTFGDIIITPHFEVEDMKVGKIVTVKISPIDNIVGYYNSKIKIESAGEESSIINITLQEKEVEKGIEILDGLIIEYNREIIEQKNKIVEATSNFINNRLQVVSSELSQVDLTAESIKKDNRLTDLTSQSSIYLQSERDIESQQIATATQLQVIDYMDNYLRENSGTGELIPANMSFEDNAINNMTQQHNELVIQRNRILRNSSEINPVVVALDGQIKSLKQSFKASMANIKSSNEMRLEALKAEDSRISSKIYSAPRKERQFRDLSRQQDIKESLYLYLLQKREESAVTYGVSSPNAIIVDNAYSSPIPIWPLKEIIFLGAFILGLLFPIVIIYLNSLFDSKVRTKADIIKYLTIPFLGDIPKSKTKDTIVKKVDYSPMAEAFRLVRTNIDFMLANVPKEEGKVVFVTSTTSEEGKSNTSINLAKSLSYSSKRVLLIETDIRVPKANKYLKIDAKIGLTDHLVNNKINFAETVVKINENLYMLPAGTIPPNPAELLMSDRMASLFETVKKDYDYIIVDTAAVGLVTDTLVISKFADLVIFVVRANYLDTRQLNVAETMYSEKRLPNMAILLNCVKSKKGYGYGYGSETTKKKPKWKLV